ncbi:hypothetical protein [Paenibacillus xanthanilyticus]|uniref:YhfM-like domain-containing protein n=1 Tax=Paenibacillus xanthanilyticus TaxID=1783531 RepID=A0ABV8K7J2_9BACL
MRWLVAASVWVLTLTVILTGCSKEPVLDVEQIADVRLTCIQSCLEDERKPFTERIFDDGQSIAAFARAVNEAEEMAGAIDYGAYFQMTVQLDNGNSREFHLNIQRTEEEQNGLLVRLENTNVGYRIPAGLSESLEEIIYDQP